MEEPRKIDNAVTQVIDTLKFYGVELVGMESDLKVPSFRVKVTDSAMKRDLEETLNITYWILWTLTYGTRDKDNESLKIDLKYDYDK